MKLKKFLARLLIILCLATIFAFSGCAMITVGLSCQSCLGCVDCIGGSCSEEYLTDKLVNYSLCEFVDDNLGIGFKIFDGGNSAHVYWGYVTINGEKRDACFDVYGNGITNIYFPDEENGWSFNERAATVKLAFAADEIICKSVESNDYNLNFSGLRLKFVSLDRSAFLPHEGSFTQSFSDKNQIIQVSRSSRSTHYYGRVRTLKEGEIKTYKIRMAFLADEVFEIYDAGTNELISSGAYDVIDRGTATLKFGQNDNLYAEKPFDSYPYLTISNLFYEGIF